MESVRIDKWLWAARFFKTRSLATDAVNSGSIKCNEVKTKPSHTVKVGEKIWIKNGTVEWEIVVQKLADKRGSAVIAQTLYQETEESIQKRQIAAEQRRLYTEPSLTIKGRPTKRDRRRLSNTQF